MTIYIIFLTSQHFVIISILNNKINKNYHQWYYYLNYNNSSKIIDFVQQFCRVLPILMQYLCIAKNLKINHSHYVIDHTKLREDRHTRRILAAGNSISPKFQTLTFISDSALMTPVGHTYDHSRAWSTTYHTNTVWRIFATHFELRWKNSSGRNFFLT